MDAVKSKSSKLYLSRAHLHTPSSPSSPKLKFAQTQPDLEHAVLSQATQYGEIGEEPMGELGQTLHYEVQDEDADQSIALCRPDLLKMSAKEYLRKIASSGKRPEQRSSIDRNEQVNFHIKTAKRYLNGALGTAFDDGSICALIDRQCARIALLSPRKLLTHSALGGSRAVLECCDDLRLVQENWVEEGVESNETLNSSVALMCWNMCRLVEFLRKSVSQGAVLTTQAKDLNDHVSATADLALDFEYQATDPALVLAVKTLTAELQDLSADEEARDVRDRGRAIATGEVFVKRVIGYLELRTAAMCTSRLWRETVVNVRSEEYQEYHVFSSMRDRIKSVAVAKTTGTAVPKVKKRASKTATTAPARRPGVMLEEKSPTRKRKPDTLDESSSSDNEDSFRTGESRTSEVWSVKQPKVDIRSSNPNNKRGAFVKTKSNKRFSEDFEWLRDIKTPDFSTETEVERGERRRATEGMGMAGANPDAPSIEVEAAWRKVAFGTKKAVGSPRPAWFKKKQQKEVRQPFVVPVKERSTTGRRAGLTENKQPGKTKPELDIMPMCDCGLNAVLRFPRVQKAAWCCSRGQPPRGCGLELSYEVWLDAREASLAGMSTMRNDLPAEMKTLSRIAGQLPTAYTSEHRQQIRSRAAVHEAVHRALEVEKSFTNPKLRVQAKPSQGQTQAKSSQASSPFASQGSARSKLRAHCSDTDINSRAALQDHRKSMKINEGQRSQSPQSRKTTFDNTDSKQSPQSRKTTFDNTDSKDERLQGRKSAVSRKSTFHGAGSDNEEMGQVTRPSTSPNHWANHSGPQNIFHQYVQENEDSIRSHTDPSFRLQVRKWMYNDDRNIPRYKQELGTLGRRARDELNRRFGNSSIEVSGFSEPAAALRPGSTGKISNNGRIVPDDGAERIRSLQRSLNLSDGFIHAPRAVFDGLDFKFSMK